MKKTALLLGVNAKNIFGINKAFHGSGKERQRAIFRLIGGVVLGLFLCASLFGMYYGMAQALDSVGALGALLSMAVVGASVLTIIDTLFRTTNVLFSFKDYDIIMSLPIKTGSVVMSRIASMYMFDLFFSLMVMVPALIAYALFATPDIGFYILFIIMTLSLPLIPMSVGIIPGVLIGLLVSRMKRKSIMSLIATFVLMAVYFYLYYNLISSNLFVDMDSGSILAAGGAIQSIYPPSAWFVNGLSGSIAYTAAFIAVGVAAIGVITLALSSCYKKLHDIVTAQKTTSGVAYKFGSIRGSTQFKALYKREWRYYTSSTPYMMNTLFGYIMLLALGVLAVIFRDSLIGFFVDTSAALMSRIHVVIAFMTAGFIACSTISSVSISLEGKQLWVLQSIPVPAMKVFRVKMFFSAHIGVIVSLMVSALLVIAFSPNVATAVIMFVIPAVFAIFYSVFGLWINLLLPKFDWKTQMQAVKQGASTLIVNVAGMFLAMGLLILLLMTDIDVLLFSSIVTAAFLILTILMLELLRVKANSIMRRLAEK